MSDSPPLDPPAEFPSPPRDAGIDEVIGLLRDYLDKRNTSQLVINQRLDFLVGELGGLREMGKRVEQHDDRLKGIEIVQQSVLKIVSDMQTEITEQISSAQDGFDTRTQVVLKDAEHLRVEMRDAMVAFQKAQQDQNGDWDDKWLTLRADLDKLSNRFEARQAESATITVSKIGRSERVAIAAITVIGGALVALLSSLIINAVQQVR